MIYNLKKKSPIQWNTRWKNYLLTDLQARVAQGQTVPMRTKSRCTGAGRPGREPRGREVRHSRRDDSRRQPRGQTGHVRGVQGSEGRW